MEQSEVWFGGWDIWMKQLAVFERKEAFLTAFWSGFGESLG